MELLLTGDVGGTKTLLSLTKIELDLETTTLHSDRYASQDYNALSEIIHLFLDQAAKKLGHSFKIDTACFGIAGPVINNTSFLPNLNWSLDGAQIEAEIGINRVVLINDFASIGYGLLGLESSDLHPIQAGEPLVSAPIALIGAGTGLGVGYLTWNHDSYEVHASEAGHCDFSPRNAIEDALLSFLRTRHERVSVERVVSGRGIVSIYQFLRAYRYEKKVTPLSTKLQDWETGDTSIDMGAAISEAAIQKTDPMATETIQIFLDAYASEIGNLALTILPYAGLYVAGGIAPKLLSLIASCHDGQARRFLNIVKQRGRVSPMIDRIPIHIVLNQNVGLIGTTIYGAKLQSRK
jgi:glucokinase